MKPFRRVGTPGRGRIVALADHASNAVPGDIDLGIDPALLDTHIAVDLGIEGVTVALAERHGIAAHLATVSRLVCDFHRREDEPAAVPEISDGHPIPGNRNADIESRLARFHRPYHDALTSWLQAAEPALVLVMHSFTPTLETSTIPRPWDVALLYNRDDRAARHAIELFAVEGLTVGDNEPYSGRQLNATMGPSRRSPRPPLSDDRDPAGPHRDPRPAGRLGRQGGPRRPRNSGAPGAMTA